MPGEMHSCDLFFVEKPNLKTKKPQPLQFYIEIIHKKILKLSLKKNFIRGGSRWRQANVTQMFQNILIYSDFMGNFTNLQH